MIVQILSGEKQHDARYTQFCINNVVHLVKYYQAHQETELETKSENVNISNFNPDIRIRR